MEQLPLLPLSVKQNHPMKPARFYLPLALRSARSLEPGGLGPGSSCGIPSLPHGNTEAAALVPQPHRDREL